MCSNLPSRTTQEVQHECDEQVERTRHKPGRTVHHHQGEPQGQGSAETGTVPPEMGELPTQTSRKNCMESLASCTLLETDSLLCGLDGNKDIADEASKQSVSNHQRESVSLVSSCIEAGCYSTATDIAGFPSGRSSKVFECMVWLRGVHDSVSIHQMLNREENHCWTVNTWTVGALWLFFRTIWERALCLV